MDARRWRPGSHSLVWDVVAVLGILALIFGVGAFMTWLHRTTPSWYLGADQTSISSCGWDTNHNDGADLVAEVVLDNPTDRTANLAVNVEWDDAKHYPVALGTGFGGARSVHGLASQPVMVEGNLDPESAIDPLAMPTSDALTCKVIGPSTIAPPRAK